ncbi:MAG: bifunctional UDP-N-acetylglucosamine diphosphorylase/glucosamine-1-phosphate N-acetyltransferase GlmU [Actinomycetota bacterium]|nr:bifunctional UDP-N-acetylglucosamine diphosphorylase/glucosamine-1-phosphate N-acetyltransferase GlmU [Actinomycetota bacterium]
MTVRPLAVVVLAAGEGTRMRSATPKVLHAIGGRSLIAHVVSAARALDPEHLLVVVGHGRDEVTAALSALDPAAVAVVQEQQNGTGHAVRVALDTLGQLDGTVVVVPGDAPLLTAETLCSLVETHQATGAATTLLSARLPDPTGYGRVVRAPDGSVLRIVEHKDADESELLLEECAVSVYAFEGLRLREALSRLGTANAQGEEYLTDVVAVHRQSSLPVAAHVASDPDETVGVNDRAQLAETARSLRDRIVRRHQLAGVAVLDPRTTWIDVAVEIEPDVTIAAGCHLLGATRVHRGAVVGPDTTLVDSVVGAGATVLRSQCQGAVVGPRATVGPFAYLRPGTVLGEGAKVGAFVEVKGSDIGPGAKVPHLAYVGDASVGPRSNIGAGTIVVNYDGRAKHRTEIGEDVRIGSNNSLVAPVRVADGAYTAAGSTITTDVPAGALGVGRAQQRNIEGWVARKRPPADQGEQHA